MLRTESYATTPAGRVAATGVPLTMTKAVGGDITLDWGASCLSTDTDYAIYEGTIGVFYSHDRSVCSTGGASTATIRPGAGSTYYLVVPLNSAWEGSYGTDSAGTERPASTDACLSQYIGTCP